MTITRYLATAALLALVTACTRSASTPPPGEEVVDPQDSTNATLQAVRSALLTQTGEAGGSGAEATPVPTSVPTTATPTPITTSSTTETAAEFVEYTVKPGDWLFQIAENFGVDPQAIVDLNGLTSNTQLVPGLVLKIPPSTGAVATPLPGTRLPGGTIHVVKPGEWIWQIARIYGVDPQAIIDANNLANPALIFPGLELVIP
ncbi:MAG: LysM domain-containing protein [Chloroflexota bacterium]